MEAFAWPFFWSVVVICITFDAYHTRTIETQFDDAAFGLEEEEDVLD
jgi:hypothetical protein